MAETELSRFCPVDVARVAYCHKWAPLALINVLICDGIDYWQNKNPSLTKMTAPILVLLFLPFLPCLMIGACAGGAVLVPIALIAFILVGLREVVKNVGSDLRDTGHYLRELATNSPVLCVTGIAIVLLLAVYASRRETALDLPAPPTAPTSKSQKRQSPKRARPKRKGRPMDKINH